MTALVFVFLFGPTIIAALRVRQGKGQPIRDDGPQSHLVTKKGTPTMGGLMILSGLVVSTLLWANLTNPYVWVVLFVTIGFGAIGFYDDYLKVTKQTDKGFSGKARLAIEFVDRRRSPASCIAHDRHGAAVDVARLSLLQGPRLQSRLVLRAVRAPSSSSAPATR